MELAAEEDRRRIEGAIGGRHGPLPVLAVVGRPNVGKSTLVNRIIGRREAVVEDRPGRHPRPRHLRGRLGRPPLQGRRHRRLGAGRRSASRRPSPSRPSSRSTLADAVVFVVDATVGVTDTDEAVVRLLRKAGKPVVLCANKVDGPRGEADAASLWSLGLGEPYPVSALHGRGTGDLLDAVLEALPEASAHERRRARRPAPDRAHRPPERRQVLAAEQGGRRGARRRRRRRRHHPRPGRRADRTRRQDLDVRRHRRHPLAASTRRRRRLLRLAAHRRPPSRRPRSPSSWSTPPSRSPSRTRDHHAWSVEAGPRAGHRVQQVGHHRRGAPLLPRARDRAGPRAGAWAPRVNISAQTGWHIDRWSRRSRRRWRAGTPASRPAGSTPSSASSSPRTRTRCAAASSPASCSARRRPPARRGSSLFATGFLDAGYRRYIERRLRETFGFEGTPISISVRVREKRKR